MNDGQASDLERTGDHLPWWTLSIFVIPFIVLNGLSDVAYDVGIAIRTARMVCIAGYRHLFVRASVSATLDDLSSVLAQRSFPASYFFTEQMFMFKQISSIHFVYKR
jgi:hypothetical protein